MTMLVEVDPEEEHHKLVYAKFGLAVYFSQVFEQGLINLITLLEAANTPDVTREMLDELFSSHSKKTLGVLIKRANKYVTFTSETTAILEDALTKRNYLIHYYFNEKVVNFTSEDGRNTMISELEDIRKCLSDADHRIDPVINALTKRLGFTEDMLKKAAISLVGKEYAGKLI